MNLILIARKANLLEEISQQIKTKFQVQVEIILVDFNDDSKEVYEQVEQGIKDKDIGVLVNNVGMSYGFNYFNKANFEDVSSMIKVNVTSLTLMTKIVLPLMESKGQGAIVNISSVAGLGPQPYLCQYASTKAYNDFFSRGLAYECQNKGITVQCVYPGPVMTDMLTLSMNDVKTTSWLVPTADQFAATALRTLGFTPCTTGYWSHALISNLSGWTWNINKINKATYEKYAKKE